MNSPSLVWLLCHGVPGIQSRRVGGQELPGGSFSGSPSAWGEPATMAKQRKGFGNKTDLYEYCWYHKYVCRPSQDACGQEGRSRTWCTHAGHTRKHGNFKHLPLNNSNHVFFNPTSGRLPMCSWHPHTSFSGFSPAVCIHPSLSCLINKFVKC